MCIVLMKNRLMNENKKYEEDKFNNLIWSSDEKHDQQNQLTDGVNSMNNYKTPDKISEPYFEDSSTEKPIDMNCPPSSYATSPSKLLETITEQPTNMEMDNTCNMKSDESSSKHKSEEFNDYFKTPADSKTKYIPPSKIKLSNESKVPKTGLDYSGISTLQTPMSLNKFK